MARTILNQSTQVGASVTYQAIPAPGSTLQTAALTTQDDFNSLRSQVNNILDNSGAGQWYDDLSSSSSGKKRGIKQLNNSLDAIESKAVLAMASLPASITVPSGQNYVVLSVASSQTPTQSAALNLTTLGAVVAQSAYSGTGFAVNELALIAGSNAQTPKNRCVVIDATTKAVLETSDNDIFGLLQFESTGADGSAFNDTSAGARVKISFVYFNPTTNAVVACPATDIAGKSFRYSYDFRTTFGGLNEDAFLNPNFVDSVAAVDVTLTRATTNQAGVAIPTNTDVLWRVANGVNFKVQNNSGGKDLLAIMPSATGNAGTVATDTFGFTTTSPITSVKGASVATAAQALNLGVTTGQIDSAGPLTLKSTGNNALALAGGSTLTLVDGFEAASTWVSGAVPLASNTTDWSAYKLAYGEVSLLAGILKAGQMGSHSISTVNVTAATIPAGTTVTGAGSAANLSAALPNTSATPNPNSNIKIYLNGSLLSVSDDYSFVSGTTTSDLTFTFALKGGTAPDKIKLECFQNPADNF